MKSATFAVLTGFFVLVSAQSVLADDLPTTLTLDGVTYEQVQWTNATPSTVTIFHKTGVATIQLEKLPPELRKRFGYDPKKAAEYRAAEIAAENAARAASQRREAEKKEDADKAQREATAQLRSAVKTVIPESTWSSIFLQIADEQKHREGRRSGLDTLVIEYASARLREVQKRLDRGDSAGAGEDALIGVLLGWYGLELTGDSPESLTARSSVVELRKVLVQIGLESSTLEPSYVNMNRALRTLGWPTLSRLN